MPNGSPAAQPRLAPTLVPMKMNSFTFGGMKQETHPAALDHAGAAALREAGTLQWTVTPPRAAFTISSFPPHIAAR